MDDDKSLELLLSNLKESKNKYDFDTKERTIEIIDNKFCNKKAIDEKGEEYEIDGSSEIYIPPYQRSYRWDYTKQCEFIESLLLEMPIPYIYLAGITGDDDSDFIDEGRLEIVDGSQRIRTIHKFLNDEFTLGNLKKLVKFNGYKYSDLPEAIRRKFLRTSIKWIELNGISLEDRKDFFRRINSNGVRLEDSDIRKGIFEESEFYNMLNVIVDSKLFKDLMKFSDKKKNKEEEYEYLTRFFCYYDQFDNYKGKVKDFLYSYVEDNQNISEKEKQEKIDLFNTVFLFVKKNFSHGFIKPKKDKISSVISRGISDLLNSRVYFEAISVGVALALKENKSLKINKLEIDKFLTSNDFFSLVSSDGANSRSKFNERILYVKNYLIEHAEQEC